MKRFVTYIFIALLSSSFSLITYHYLNNNKNEQETKNLTKMQEESKSNLHQVTYSPASDRPGKVNHLPDFTEIVKKTKNSVVHVRNTRYVQKYYPYSYGYREGPIYKQEGTGSGVIISPDGFIVTNNHVIKDANEIEVTLDNNKTYKAKLIGTDVNTDIAILKINANNLPYIVFGDSDDVQLGEWALAIGNPYNLGTTVTAGIISAKGRDLKGNNKIENFIQTDAVVNPGNSGGALVNERGELIGINTMIFSMNGSYIGYSFAIPSNIVRKIVDDILEYGSIKKGVLGIKGVELNNEMANRLNIDETKGIYIYEIEPQTGAYRSGLHTGDIIIKIDNVDIKTMADLLGFLKTKRPGDKIEITVLREGKEKVFDIELSQNNAAYLKTMGISVKNIDKKTLSKYGVDHGVFIDGIKNRILYENGIRPGYIITRINDVKIHNVDDLTDILTTLNNSQYTMEVVSPNGRIEKYIFR
jgi:Do/DeqQ family serine protease